VSALPPAFHAAHDAFGRTAALAFTASFPFLGVPLHVRSNAEAAVTLATQTFGPWASLASRLVRRDGHAHLDVIVHGDDTSPPSRLDYRSHGDVFMSAGQGLLSTVRLDTQHAVAFVSPSALGAPDWFTAHVNGLGILAATQRDRLPLHAACIVRDTRAWVLIGASGIGKSTLTYACHDAGVEVLAEDTVFVSLAGEPRLWGHAACAWLAPDAGRFFPSLAGRPVVTRHNGKRRIAASLEVAGRQPRLAHEGTVTVVLLTRGADGPAATPVGHRDVVSALAAVDEGFDQYPEGRGAVVGWLSTQPAYRLAIGDDPARAVATILALPGTTS
jgi:hypothetical protein